MQLVDEQNNLAVGRLHFFQNRLEPLLELAAKLGARDQRAHIERDHALFLQTLGNVAAHDALRQPFHNGGLSHARLADQHRIVLGAPGEHLDHAADLVIAADHRIQLALRGQLRQIAAVFLQSFVSGFRILIGHPLAAAHVLQRPHQSVARDAELAEQLPGRPGIIREGEQYMLY